MKVAITLLVVFGHVCARPEVAVERKFDYDVPQQQLASEYDTASLPEYHVRSRRHSNMFHHLDNEDLVGVKQPGGTHFAVNPESDWLSRKERSIDYTENMLRSNDVSHEIKTGNPTPDMYNDNFGGEHDSQDGMISNDALRSQHLVFDADAFNRALGIQARNTPSRNNMMASKVGDEGSGSNSGVLRRIQHYQTVVAPAGPVNPELLRQIIPYAKVETPRFLWPGLFSQPGMRSLNAFPQGPMSGYVPSVMSPSVWSAYTNIVEYAPQTDPCDMERHSRKKREVAPRENKKKKRVEPEQPNMQPDQDSGYQEFFVEDLSRTAATGPRIMKLKVRKGGVAIAGPGGIATAGSGGTAIVGPGGTAYTTRDGTAIVGPGGRVIEIPSNFQTTKIEARTNDQPFFIPPGGKLLANGPFVYYGRNRNSPLAITPIIERL